MWFLAGARMYLCVCVCIWFSPFQSPITHEQLQISIWNLIHEWSSHNPSIVISFMTIDARFLILWDFDIFLKNGPGRSNFCKIPAIVLKLHRNILYRSWNFDIKFGQNRLKSWKLDTHAYTQIHIHPDAS